jgi:hypothetical protein
MLRESAAAIDVPVDARAVVDPRVDPLVPGGAELVSFVDSALAGSEAEGEASRGELRDALGDDALVDAAAVLGNFEMMNRVAGGTGMPVGRGRLAATEELRAELGLDRLAHD